jgi:hypothetical protein
VFTLLVIPSLYVLMAKQHKGEAPGAIGQDFESIEGAESALEPAGPVEALAK